jgi:hypothetical protein
LSFLPINADFTASVLRYTIAVTWRILVHNLIESNVSAIHLLLTVLSPLGSNHNCTLIDAFRFEYFDAIASSPSQHTYRLQRCHVSMPGFALLLHQHTAVPYPTKAVPKAFSCHVELICVSLSFHSRAHKRSEWEELCFGKIPNPILNVGVRLDPVHEARPVSLVNYHDRTFERPRSSRVRI